MPRLLGRLGKRGGRESLTAAEHVHRVDIFKDLSMEEIDLIFKGLMLRETHKGALLFSPEDSTDRLFMLKEGHIELYRLTPGGKRLVIRHIGPGTIFGEMGLLGQSMQGCFAEVAENSLVCTATREDMLRVVQQHPEVFLRLMAAIGNRLRTLEERLEQASFSSVRARLAAYLLANAAATSGIVSGHTQSDIADSIGAMRQTVSEELADMQREGLVEVAHKSYSYPRDFAFPQSSQ